MAADCGSGGSSRSVQLTGRGGGLALADHELQLLGGEILGLLGAHQPLGQPALHVAAAGLERGGVRGEGGCGEQAWLCLCLCGEGGAGGWGLPRRRAEGVAVPGAEGGGVKQAATKLTVLLPGP